MKQKILVIAIRKFKGEVDKINHDFTKITYLPFQSNSMNTDNEKGNYPRELSFGDSMQFDNLSKYSYPSIFEATLEVVPGRKNIKINLQELDYISSLEEVM
jgi:hypothetical protein